MGIFDRGRRTGEPLRVPRPSCIPNLATINTGAAYRSARVGGDFFEFVEAGANRLVFAMFDIAGKRDSALHIAASVQDVLRERSPELVGESSNINEGLSELTLALNRAIQHAAQGVHNAPAFLGCYDDEFGTLSYINAGHVPAIVSDQDGVAELESGGLPLGLFSHVVHDPKVLVLVPGAALVLISKGVLEARSGGKEFGLERVKLAITSQRFRSAEELCAQILHSVDDFSKAPSYWGPQLGLSGFGAHDVNDMTAVALMRPAVGMSVSAMAG